MSLCAEDRDEVTPIATLVGFKRQYMISWIQIYHEFFEQVGLDLSPDIIGAGRTGGTYAASCKLFQEVSHGIRRLDWCPAGVSLYGNLHRFFLAQGMDFYADDDFIQGRLLNLMTPEDAWLVISESRYYPSAQEHKASVHDSGVFDDLRLPNMVQLAYLIAAIVFRHKKIAAASLDQKRTLFIRSSSSIGPNNVLAASYVPGMGLFFKAFPITYSGPDLVTMDAFVLP
jgi:hypothetical protein